MFYTTEEAAIIGGFLELYLERDSVDPAVRERHRKFRQGLMRGALERADYEWAAATLLSLIHIYEAVSNTDFKKSRFGTPEG